VDAHTSKIAGAVDLNCPEIACAAEIGAWLIEEVDPFDGETNIAVQRIRHPRLKHANIANVTNAVDVDNESGNIRCDICRLFLKRKSLISYHACADKTCSSEKPNRFDGVDQAIMLTLVAIGRYSRWRPMCQSSNSEI
jgi:hypothetical protein